jgi:predicted esterase
MDILPSRVTTRRRFLQAGASAASAAWAAACRPGAPTPFADGRIVWTGDGTRTTSVQGRTALGLNPSRDAILAMPTGVASDRQVPLLILLHGAGGSADGILERLGDASAAAGIAVLAPESRGQTWDAIRGGFGPDVEFLSRALERAASLVHIDRRNLAIGGFSDGATYALSLGLINGDRFPRVAAFSPGFVVNRAAHGQPAIFICHGRRDDILPIDRCSGLIVPALRARGYDVTFREFDGGHEVPGEIAVEGMRWLCSCTTGLPEGANGKVRSKT